MLSIVENFTFLQILLPVLIENGPVLEALSGANVLLAFIPDCVFLVPLK